MASVFDQSSIDRIAARIRQRAGLWVTVCVVLAVAALVVPIPPLLLDGLLLLSLAASAAALALCVRAGDPTRVGGFPTLVLLTALYRLSLLVAAARLILGTVPPRPGTVVDGLGQLLAGAYPVAGAVVFVLIVLLQLIVISRGAERVAEVAARFALDAMPGKQMAIDGDLRAGLITPALADRRRAALARESDFFGSMDGAMKFVRGEAVLSLVMIVLIFAAGLLSGATRGGMAIGAAATLYGRLTIGAGLAAQIPALLFSVAAGLLVTRAAHAKTSDAEAGAEAMPAPLEAIVVETGAELSSRLAENGSPERDLDALRQRIVDDLGLPLPPIRHRTPAADLDPSGYRVLVYGNPVDAGRIETAQGPVEAITVRLEAVLRRHAGEFLGLQEAQALLEARRGALATLIQEVVGPRVSLSQFAALLARLVAEDVPINDLRLILETLARDDAGQGGLDAWTERVRQALRRTITHRFAAGRSRLAVCLVDNEVQDLLRNGVEDGAPLAAIDPEVAGEIVAAARRCEASLPDGCTRPVFLADPDLRPRLRSLLAPDVPNAVVLSYRELSPELPIESVGRLSLAETPAS